MTLNEYLSVNDIPPPAFAYSIDVSPQAVYRYLDGSRMPKRPILLKISEQTGGAVTANDFIERAPPRTSVQVGIAQ